MLSFGAAKWTSTVCFPPSLLWSSNCTMFKILMYSWWIVLKINNIMPLKSISSMLSIKLLKQLARHPSLGNTFPQVTSFPSGPLGLQCQLFNSSSQATAIHTFSPLLLFLFSLLNPKPTARLSPRSPFCPRPSPAQPHLTLFLMNSPLDQDPLCLSVSGS